MPPGGDSSCARPFTVWSCELTRTSKRSGMIVKFAPTPNVFDLSVLYALQLSSGLVENVAPLWRACWKPPQTSVPKKPKTFQRGDGV